MKKILLLLFCCTLGLVCLAQQDSSRPKTMSDQDLGMYYLKKNRSQKTIGWVMLGGGTALYIIGASSFDLYSESSAADVALVAGSFAMVASIPLFISAAKNKGRAEILLRHENIPINYKYRKGMPAIGIQIALSR